MRQPDANKYAGKAVYLGQKIKDCDVIVLGTSHAQTALNPALFSQHGLNFSSDGQPYYYSYQFLEKYLPQMPKLKTVVMSATYFFFFFRPGKAQENLYSAYWGLSPLSGKSDVQNYSALFTNGIWQSILAVLGKKEEFTLVNGWEKVDKVYQGSPEKTKMRIRFLHDIMADSLFAENKAWFEKIQQTCKEKQVRLVVYVPPLSAEMNRQLAHDPYQDKMVAYLDQLQRTGGLELHDFNDNSVFNDSLFCDTDHLNQQGAVILSNKINDLLHQ